MTPKRLRCLNGPDIIIGPKYVRIFLPKLGHDSVKVQTICDSVKADLSVNFPDTAVNFIGVSSNSKHPEYTYEYVF